MKYRLILIILILSIKTNYMFGQMFDPLIDMGSYYSPPFSHSNTLTASGGSGWYYYQFSISTMMDITISNYGSSVGNTNIYLYDENIELINIHSTPLQAFYLREGTYYVGVECENKYGKLVTTISGEYTSGYNPEGNRLLSKAIDAGIFTNSFSYRDDNNSYNFSNDYGRPTNDICYRFAITRPMDITISHESYIDTYIYLLDASGNSISEKHGYRENLTYWNLYTGTYYVVSEGYSTEGSIATNIKGEYWGPDGNSIENPLYIGNISGSFSYSDTQDTNDFTNNYQGCPTNDVYYIFTLERNMDVSISYCESLLYDTYVSLLDSQGNCVYENDNYDGEGGCPNTAEAYLKICNLPIGTYYVVSEGKDYNGIINTAIQFELPNPHGNTLADAIDIGRYSTSFDYSSTKDTNGFTNNYPKCIGYDIFYKFTLLNSMNIIVSHCNSNPLDDSFISDTYISILDDSGKCIYENNNYSGEGACANTSLAYLKILEMTPGTYYVVSEGCSYNGKITTNIEGIVPYRGPVPSMDTNYIMSITPTIATNTAIGLSHQTALETIQYFDGLGRPLQDIKVKASPTNSDLVNYLNHDSFGRESDDWLPIATKDNNGAFVPYNVFTQKAINKYSGDPNPYSKPIYENSPMNRIVEQYGPGKAWHDTGRSIKTNYLTNVANVDTLNCIHYRQSESSISTDTIVSITRIGNYNTGELYVTRITDEDNNTTFEFKDKLGRIVLTRQSQYTNGIKELFDTYYIYDNFNNQVAVLPPLASEKMKTDSIWDNVSSSMLRNYCYLYIYDHRNHCKAKRLPGCDWIYYIYDKGDIPIFTQDGELRKKAEWHFCIPDIFGRVCLEGICKNTFNTLASSSLSNMIVKVTSNNENNIYKGYSLSGMELTSPTVLNVNYYDNYDFLGKNGIPDSTDIHFGYESIVEFGDRYISSAKTHLTGTLTAVLDGPNTPIYLSSVMYYDSRGRLIQSKSCNHLLGGLDKEYFAYNYIGQPVKKKLIHSATGKLTQTEEYTYTYDHAGRLLTTTHQLNNGYPVVLASNEYDELGRLISNSRNDSSNLKTDYTYNIRSWIKSITGPLFYESLYYNDHRSNEANVSCYNGNISGIDWKVVSDENRGYNFSYDNLSRLTNADYLESNALSDKFTTSYCYDKHGNMLNLQRHGNIGTTTYGVIDDLTLSYDGNQLVSVEDKGTNPSLSMSMDFKDGAHESVEYSYDTNGNMVKDLNKGISRIEYNFLNLPRRVTFAGMNNPVNEYVYSAGGKKLSVIHKSSTEKRTDYVGNMIYENGSLKRILVDGGYIENGTYHFYLQDHLGNNRVVVKSDGTVVQTTHYYPYGMSFAEGTFADKQPYKYNGKELDTENGLHLYDYDARQMDGTLGRFTSVDRMVEKYYAISPYAYVGNNPLKYIDLRGDSISVAELYARDKQGELINPNQVKAFEFLASTKEGKALLANFAMKGQTIAGVIFNKDGKFHNKGINISFGTDVRHAGVSGSTNFSLNDENLNIRIVVGNSLDNADQLDTFIHEIVIHADQNSADFIDDKVMNNSNVYPVLRKMDKNRQFKQHWQERNVNKAMKRIGLPILQQYYNSQGIVKSNDAIVKSMYGFLN